MVKEGGGPFWAPFRRWCSSGARAAAMVCRSRSRHSARGRLAPIFSGSVPCFQVGLDLGLQVSFDSHQHPGYCRNSPQLPRLGPWGTKTNHLHDMCLPSFVNPELLVLEKGSQYGNRNPVAVNPRLTHAQMKTGLRCKKQAEIRAAASGRRVCEATAFSSTRSTFSYSNSHPGV